MTDPLLAGFITGFDLKCTILVDSAVDSLLKKK